MRKKYKSFLAVAMAATMVLSNVVWADTDSQGAGEGTAAPVRIHEHTDGSVVEEQGNWVVEPTCTEQGVARYDCEEEEGHFHEDLVPALGHDWDEGVVTVEPTCTEEGVLTYTCQRCGETYTEAIDALGHLWSSEVDGENWGRVIVEPTCTEEGQAEDYCTRCGEINSFIEPRIIAPHGHEFTIEVIDSEPTCVTEGQKHMECEICGAEDPESYEAIEIDPDAHNWDGWVVEKPATCAEEGLRVRWCTLCGDKEQETIPVLEPMYEEVATRLIDCYTEEHTFRCVLCDGEVHEDQIVTNPVVSHVFKDREEDILEQQDATCEEDGFITYKCIFYDDVDGHADDEEATHTVIQPAIGHDWGEWVVRHEPGEGDNELGYWMRKCQRDNCGQVQEYVSVYAPKELCEKNGHNYQVIDTIEPTCTEDGVETSKCFICGDEVEKILPATGHSYEVTQEIEATCTEPAKTVYTCSICGDSYEEENGEAAGHQYEMEVVIPATCTENGKALYTCSACGDLYTEVIEATGHTIVEDAAVEPTVDAPGKTAGSHCSVCGEVIEAQEEIPALKDGLVKDEDDVWRLYKEGEFQGDYTGIYTYDGGEFFIADGVLASDANGLNLYGTTWYFLANGQVQRGHDGFAEYNNNWFMINDGVLDENANGLFDYDGGTFLFAAGRLRTDVQGLWQDFDGTWYYLADGQVVDHEGVVEYNGAFFYVVGGKLATDYNGTIEYDGKTFRVVAGQLYAA